MAKERTPSTPQFADTPPPYTSAPDYSFLEIVMATQGTLGKLTEAVESLKEQSRSQDLKLDGVVKDVHGAKAAGKALLWAVGVVGTAIAGSITFVGWAIKSYFSVGK